MGSNKNGSKEGHDQRQIAATETWLQHEREFYRWQAEKIDLIEDTLKGLRRHGALVDVGCFTGWATARYKALGFARAVGLDISEFALERAANKGIEPRSWHAGAERCPAGDGEFDTVIAADVIEHIVDTDAFLSELHRILTPRGTMIVTTPNLAFWLSRIRLLLGKPPWSYPGTSPTVRADVMIDLNHIRVNTRREWEALFGKSEFDVRRARGWSILHAHGASIGVRLRRAVDRVMTRRPETAFGLLFGVGKKRLKRAGGALAGGESTASGGTGVA